MNSVEKEKYNWIVVGGGISGIAVAEILCRGGESVLLIEKNLTEPGASVSGSGWFNNEHMEYRYKKHSYNSVWSSLVSRSKICWEIINDY